MSSVSDDRSELSEKERALQEFPDPYYPTRQYQDHGGYDPDYYEIKRRHSIPRMEWDRTWTAEEDEKHGAFAKEGEFVLRRGLLPDIIQHYWDPPAGMKKGGTDWLAVGPPGTGKSNTGLWLCERLMEANDEKVVWRASMSRSEWLPFAPWARVCLPSGVDVQARFLPQDPTQDGFEVDLSDVVREVVRYDDPVHLNHELLKEGQFHVVYPDPDMTGLQDLYEADHEKQYEDLEFTPEDPLNHWWFGYVLARISEGPHHWTSLIFDEIGDIAPEAARADEYAHYQKVELLRDCWADARKMGLSIFAFGHSESDIHSMIRRKIRWRVTMNGTANPTSAGEVVGFNDVPMDDPITNQLDVGEFLLWSESEFQWPPISPTEIEDPIDMTLKVSFS